MHPQGKIFLSGLLALTLTACGNGGVTMPPKDYDTIVDVATPVGELIDNYYRSYRELMKTRENQGHTVDTCEAQIESQNTFASSIAFAVEEGLNARKSQINYVSAAFGLPADLNQFTATGLLTHSFCPVTAASLRDTIGAKVPTAAVIQKAQAFSDELNGYRQQALRGDTKALLSAHRLWSRFMMCLAYTESLTTADTPASQAVADQFNLPRPPGVKYYIDKAQKNPESRFNIGLFQFSPAAGGNVQACLRHWNVRYSSCPLSTKAPFADMVGILASSRQTFNAFCGVTKVVDMFGVQVNTSTRANTHPQNRLAGGKLKAPADRCVTPFYRTGASYNHFGPFQNSTRSNLGTLLDCTMAKE